MLVSVGQQHESALSIEIIVTLSHPPPYPILLGVTDLRAELRFPLLPILNTAVYTRQCSVCLTLFVSPLWIHVYSLWLSLHSFSANRLISTIFLYSINICISIWCLIFSFWLHYVWHFGFLHITTNDPILFLLWLSNIPLDMCTTTSLFIHLFMDTEIASMSCQ